MRQSRLLLLQEMPIFGGVEGRTLEYILDNANILNVDEGQYFFKEDELSNSMYVLEQGKVEVIRNWKRPLYRMKRRNAINMQHPVSMILKSCSSKICLMMRKGYSKQNFGI